jgi:type VI protein secretion system component VasK
MEEAFIFGLIWGVIVTILIQAITMLILRIGRASGQRDARVKEREERAVPARDVPDARELQQINRMQERIATLERITTDSGFRTAREIDALTTR